MLPTEPGSAYSATPPVPPRPKAITVPGYVPNYTQILSQDPGYMGAQANAGLANGMAAANRDAAIAALQYGYNGAGNRFSSLAQADRQYKLAELTGTNSLAGRGMLGSTPGMSGEKHFMDTNLAWDRDLSKYTAGQSLASQIMGALSSYLGTAQNSAASIANAAGDAYGRAIQNPLYQPSGGGQAQLVPGWQQTYGKPVYKGADGSLWTVGPDGTPVRYS